MADEFKTQALVLKAKGLKTAPNQLTASGTGAMTTASNIVIDQADCVTPRRGIYPIRDASNPYAKLTLVDKAKSCAFYNDELILHCADNKLVRWSDTTGATYYRTGGVPSVSGSATSFTPPSGFKMRFAQSNGNLYFTTDTGIRKIDSTTAAVRYAGVNVSDGQVTNSGSEDLIDGGQSVAYRVIWGYYDANNNLVLGPPSGRLVFTNPNDPGTFYKPLVSGSAPSDAQNDYFAQIYRSTVSDDVPNDELGLVYETAELGNVAVYTTFTVDDIVSDDFLSTSLYTNASQEGILQSNDRPPLARDLALFNGSMVYANLTEKHSLRLTLLSADAVAGGVKARDSIQVAGIDYLAIEGTNAVLSGVVSQTGLGYFLVGSVEPASDPYTNIQATAQSLVSAINGVYGTIVTTSSVYGAYESTPDDIPGKIVLTERIVGGSAFTATTSSATTGWRQSIPRRVVTASIDWHSLSTKSSVGFSRSGSTVTVKTVPDAHGFTTGDTVTITPIGSNTDAAFPAFTGTITVTGVDSFTYTQAGSAVDHRDNSGKYFYSITQSTVDQTGLSSTAERNPHGLAISKNGRPEAVPLTNRLLVSARTDILRIQPLRDRLFLFKEDGIWTLIGDNSANYRIDLFDSTTELLAPETVKVLGNKIFALTNQGVVALSGDGGVQIISRDIETELLTLLGQVGYAKMSELAWGVGYETERKYILHVPTSSSATACSKAYVYNLFTNTWTTQDTSFNCGEVAPTADVLYYGNSDAANVSRERKNFNYTDYADDATPATCTSAGTGTSVTVTGTGLAVVGDIYWQSASIFSRITAVVEGGGNSVLTLQTSGAYTTGDRFIYKAFTVSGTWAVDSGGNPAALKQYSAVKLFLGDISRFNKLSVSFGNELIGSGGSVILNAPTNGQYPVAIHTYVPRAAQRCSLLEVGFTHATAWDDLEINGVGLQFTPGSDRFTR